MTRSPWLTPLELLRRDACKAAAGRRCVAAGASLRPRRRRAGPAAGRNAGTHSPDSKQTGSNPSWRLVLSAGWLLTPSADSSGSSSESHQDSDTFYPSQVLSSSVSFTVTSLRPSLNPVLFFVPFSLLCLLCALLLLSGEKLRLSSSSGTGTLHNESVWAHSGPNEQTGRDGRRGKKAVYN